MAIRQLDVQLGSTFDDGFPRLGRYGMSNLPDVSERLHEKHIEVLKHKPLNEKFQLLNSKTLNQCGTLDAVLGQMGNPLWE